MTKLIYIFLVLFISHSPSYEAEDQDARKALDTPLNSLPFSVHPHPPETSYNEASTLDQAQGMNTIGGQFMKNILETGPHFRLRHQSDPIMITSQKVNQNAKAILEGQAVTFDTYEYDVEKKCVEGRPTVEVKCTHTLKTGVHAEQKKTYYGTLHVLWYGHETRYWTYNEPHETTRQIEYFKRGDNYMGHRIEQHYTYERRHIHFNRSTGTFEAQRWKKIDEPQYTTFNPLSVNALDKWESSCPDLEKSRRCRVKDKVCISRQSAQTISDTQTPLTFVRPCFQYEVTYLCQGSSKQECQPLRRKGCVQVNSTCQKSLKGECVEWEQKMRCPTLQGVKKSVTIPSSVHGSSWKVEKELPHVKNTDFTEVMAKLSLFREMQKDTGAHTISVFKGTTNRCTKAFAGFKDCCGKQSGWGITFNLSGCNGEDQALAQKRAKNLCVEVGEYCAEREKITKICLRKKKSFCCFESKLSRIFHEQGRRQLGLGWGEPKDPQCRGLTVEELQRMDFDRIDLSELTQDILSQVKVPDVGATTQQLKDRLTAMTQSVTQTPTQGGL